MYRTLEYRIHGWPGSGCTLNLSEADFSYAGQFVRSTTGKAVACRGDTVFGACSFTPDRGVEAGLRIRYITVHEDYRGNRIGPALASFLVDKVTERDYEVVRIAVNNPAAYVSMYRAGFAYTGETRDLGEVILEAPATDRKLEPYRRGLETFSDRELPETQESLCTRTDAVPAVIEL